MTKPINSDQSQLNWKRVISWSLYDWANSAYATTVMAAFFPIFYGAYWHGQADATTSTAYLGYAGALSGVFIAILAPILGTIADKGSMKKLFLGFFALIGIVFTFSFAFIGENQWMAALVVYVISMIGFSGANIFYDSMMVSVAPDKKSDFVSSLGFGLGYLGGGLLFLVNVGMALAPEKFGLADNIEATKLAFISVSVWWSLFAIPIFLYVPEPGAKRKSIGFGRAAKEGFAQLRVTLKEISGHKNVWMFLLAYFFYIDGVNTIIKMAVKYGQSLGFDSNSLIVALLLIQFVAFPAALVYGWLGEKWGTKKAILLAIAVYAGITVGGYLMQTVTHFYALAIAVGLVQGGVQALSRSFFSRLIPEEKAGEFFGFYNMLGKFATVIGPVLMGVTGQLTGDVRISILSLIILFVIGGGLLIKVPTPEVKKSEFET